jgi:hypothetical protein
MLTREKCNELFREVGVVTARPRVVTSVDAEDRDREGIRLTAAWYREAGWL